MTWETHTLTTLNILIKMRFSTILVGAFAAIVAAQASSSPTTTLASPATTASLDPAQATYIACLKGCRDDDVNCRAKCGNVS